MNTILNAMHLSFSVVKSNKNWKINIVSAQSGVSVIKPEFDSDCLAQKLTMPISMYVLVNPWMQTRYMNIKLCTLSLAGTHTNDVHSHNDLTCIFELFIFYILGYLLVIWHGNTDEIKRNICCFMIFYECLIPRPSAPDGTILIAEWFQVPLPYQNPCP